MKLTRSAAQSYCRAHFVDLATFETEEDWEAVRELAERTTFWIGLYQDRRAWKWSLDNTYLYGDDGNIAYGDWFVFQINHYLNSQVCGKVTGGNLSDLPCEHLLNSVCYDEPNNKYIPVTVPMTWSSAQSYCREKYTDLTSMRNQQEKEEILKVTDESTWWIVSEIKLLKIELKSDASLDLNDPSVQEDLLNHVNGETYAWPRDPSEVHTEMEESTI
ncbi:hypothetical protein NQZ68_007464 [Dissostichus eleginoides]|nr:hypothetical protein NQZ68_007464 [Dissostichus eleginoides]